MGTPGHHFHGRMGTPSYQSVHNDSGTLATTVMCVYMDQCTVYSDIMMSQLPLGSISFRVPIIV